MQIDSGNFDEDLGKQYELMKALLTKAPSKPDLYRLLLFRGK